MEKLLYDDSTAGQTFELYGPKKYSYAEVAAMVDKEIFKQRRHFNLPKSILKPVAGALNSALWWHTTSADEIEREFLDQKIDRKAKTFKDLGIETGDIADFTYHYLVRHTSFIVLDPKISCLLTIFAARIPQRKHLRLAAGHRKGETREQEVYPRSGRVVNGNALLVEQRWVNA